MKIIITLALFITFSGLVMGITHIMYDLGGILFFGGIATTGFCVLFIKKPKGPISLLLNVFGLMFASIPGTLTILLLGYFVTGLRLSAFFTQILFVVVLFSLLILKANQSFKKSSS